MNPTSHSPAKAALSFVERHGVVLASARGPAPRLVEEIAGEVIQGNWWVHPRANFIYNTLAEEREDDNVLVCRLLSGKITLVHRRLWPAVVRLALQLDPDNLARVADTHTASGKHISSAIAFPDWVTPDVLAQSAQLTEQQAKVQLPTYLLQPRRKSRKRMSITSRRTENAG